jgi:predicted anti-sigma-YlaC factor YlaD
MIQFKHRSRFLQKSLMPEQPPECRRNQAQLTDFLERTLTSDEEAAVSKHLAECASCRQVLNELQHTILLLGQLRGSAPPTRDPAHLRDGQSDAT